MATSPRGLGFVLTMAACVAASIHTGSPGSGWWGTEEARTLRQAAKRSIQQGNFAQAGQFYLQAAALASRHHDPLARAWALEGDGSASFANFDYRGAIDTYLGARRFAEQARSRQAMGAIDADLASVYQQMGDVESAVRSAEEARVITQGLEGVYYRPQLLLLLGRLRGDASSIALYREGIAAAHAATEKDRTQAVVEASGWDLLGEASLAQGDWKAAEAAAQQALALRQSSDRRDLGLSDWVLGAVRLQEAEGSQGPTRARLLAEAEHLTQRAALVTRRPPMARLDEQRGQILLAEGRTPEALEAMEQAIVEAQRWRLGVAPALTSLDGAATTLQTNIFDRFVDAAADYGLRFHDQRWVEESFEASELNRAANLRDSAQAGGRRALPAEYWEALGQLEVEETKSGQTDLGASPVSNRLRLRLTELESGAGLGYSSTIAEIFPSHNSLIHFQKSLRDSQLLLSFALGERESWLWAVTRTTLHVYRLPPAAEIIGTVRAFRQALERGTEGFEDLGGQLYRLLLGQLRTEERAKSVWQLSVEEALLEVPFAALVVEHERSANGPEKKRSGEVVFLAERHSLEVKAGALLPGKQQQAPAGGFVSVADPVYNVADARWTGRSSWTAGSSWITQGSTFLAQWFPIRPGGAFGGQLNRLPGTHREAEASAAAWQGVSGGSTTILEGASASRTRFLEALSPVPRVIHLATHALSSSAGDEAYLAFGLGRDGQPQMLSASEIRTLHVPGSVVVMTGCATAPSDVQAGLGLAGLVRAWTIAGARAVVATEWAVQDSAGSSLLASFYRHLGKARRGTVAQALRLAQVEMMHSAGVAPAAWAAYQVFAGRASSRSEAP